MRKHRFFGVIMVFIMAMGVGACSGKPVSVDKPVPTPKALGNIYLYGEQHGVEKIINKEFELWSEYYEKEDMRHLFIELPYYTAEFLNIWMQSDNDEILDEVYDDWRGTASYNQYNKEFYKKIKSECPETIFHGTDVGHQYDTTGKRYLEYLEKNRQEDSKQYLLAKQTIDDGKYFYDNDDGVFRENKLAENFIREVNGLSGENVMGIYGSAHTQFEGMDYATESVPCMANQLKEIYNESIYSKDLSSIAKEVDPIRVDKVVVNKKEYEASYFGKQELTGIKDYVYREFWRLENAYKDFKNIKRTENVLPYDNYPMVIETGQVFMIDYTKTDSSVVREYYLSNGKIWQNSPATEEIKVD